jgi:hypothetical protein
MHNRESTDIRNAKRAACEHFEKAQRLGNLKDAEVVLEEFSRQMNTFRQRWVGIAATLGQNFLGPTTWTLQGIDVGEAPPIPATITQELLESQCPLHPQEQIKDTHLLVLIPKTVNGEPYSARKLGELCAERQRGADMLIDETERSWRCESWAAESPTQSEWVFIPKSDPQRVSANEDKHFRLKNVVEQEAVHKAHYTEYREARTLELVTAVVLSYLTHDKKLLPEALRCKEGTDIGSRVCVGFFGPFGLWINVDSVDGAAYEQIGRALVREL